MTTTQHAPDPPRPLFRGLDAPGHLRALYALRDLQGPISTRGFEKRVGTYSEKAKRILQAFQQEGLVSIERGPRQGAISPTRVRLTQKGEAACRILDDLRALLEPTAGR